MNQMAISTLLTFEFFAGGNPMNCLQALETIAMLKVEKKQLLIQHSDNIVLSSVIYEVYEKKIAELKSQCVPDSHAHHQP